MVRDQDLEINRLGGNKDDSDGDGNNDVNIGNNDVNVGNNSNSDDGNNGDNVDSTRSRQLSGFFATPSN